MNRFLIASVTQRYTSQLRRETVRCGISIQSMSASLIGRLGSSTFRLPTTPVSMSLTGSRFSSDSALRPFHHGIRRRGGTILWATLPSM
jgi:hypothetical protein